MTPATALPPVHTPMPPGARPHALSPGLRRLTQVLRAAVLLGALALCTVPLLFWWSPEWVRRAAPAIVGTELPLLTVDGRAQALGALASLPGVGAGLWLLWRLWQLLHEYLQGLVFSPRALRALRGFARALAVCALLGPLQRTAVGLALTLGNPPGQRHLVLGLDGGDLLGLMLAATLWLVASVMAEAARIADENDAFI